MGWIDENKAILETLFAFKRAGADLIATYFAKDAVRLVIVNGECENDCPSILVFFKLNYG